MRPSLGSFHGGKPMNINISLQGQNLAMDGQQLYKKVTKQQKKITSVTESAAHTTKQIQDNLEQTKKDVQELQSFSNTIGRKIHFSINDSLGDVIIKVVDPNTDKVIKEIPSKEIQDLKLHMKQTFGFLVDEMR